MLLTKRPERMKWVMENIWQLAEKFVHPDGPLGLTLEVGDWPPPQIWLGVTAENQEMADQRIPILLQTPAAKRFVSVEPMLGPVDIKFFLPCSHCRGRGWYLERFSDNHGTPCTRCQDEARGVGVIVFPGEYAKQGPRLDWVIAGGESGPGARPMHPDWPRSLREQCQAAEVPFFFKQWGEWAEVRETDQDIVERFSKDVISYPNGDLFFRVGKKAAGRELDGRTWDEYPGGEG
jgi:protein gp37